MRAVFFGLGADGTVGRQQELDQDHRRADRRTSRKAYFVYDSKKSGAVTISHLRFGPQPIRAPYLISQASFVGCHQFNFLGRYDVLELGRARRRVSPECAVSEPTTSGNTLPFDVQAQIIEKQLRFYVIDAYAVAEAAGMGTRINTDHADVLLRDFAACCRAMRRSRASSRRSRRPIAKRGDRVVRRNYEAVDADAGPPPAGGRARDADGLVSRPAASCRRS